MFFFPPTQEDMNWSDSGTEGQNINDAGLHSYNSNSTNVKEKNYFDPTSMTADDYYAGVWNELLGALGVGEAGRQAIWNAKMQDWQNNFNAKQSQLERDFNAQQTSAQNAFNSEEALKEREWQERMSSTAYQRAVSDLKNAGLNPVLAVAQPSSSGQGAYASGSALGASSFIGSALGASGINSTFGVSALSTLANTAMSAYRTSVLGSHFSRMDKLRSKELMTRVVDTLAKVFKFIR